MRHSCPLVCLGTGRGMYGVELCAAVRLAVVEGARRAVDFAHAAIRDRLRGWSPGSPIGFAISPSVGFASLSGLSDGFDYTGSSESLSGSVELGADTWQAGVIASFTRTDLRYRAQASLSRRGYRAGRARDRDRLPCIPLPRGTHRPEGSFGRRWVPDGATSATATSWVSHPRPTPTCGSGLTPWALLSPLADVLSGELDAEAGIDAFDLEIDGGGQISASLPTLRGRDYRTGLAWSAPVPGTPFVSLAYKQLTGDGPEGARGGGAGFDVCCRLPRSSSHLDR